MENEELEKQELSSEPIEPTQENIEETEEVEDEEDYEPLHHKVQPQKQVQKAPVVIEYEDQHLQNVEDKREVFLKFYKKQRMVKWIIGMVALAFAILVWLLVPNLAKDEEGNLAKWALPVMISGVAFAMIIVFIYTLLIKKTINKKMKEYFTDFYSETAGYTFQSEVFEEAILQNPDKIEKFQFTENGMFVDIDSVGSRGLIEFKYHDKLMMVCDCAAHAKGRNRIVPVFVGKYLVGPASYQDSEPIIVYLKGKEGDNRVLPPTNVDENDLVIDNGFLSIWTKNSKWKHVVNEKVIEAFKTIDINEGLIDVSISLHDGKAFICLGFDDPLLVLPLEQQFNPYPYVEYKKTLEVVCQVIEVLNK